MKKDYTVSYIRAIATTMVVSLHIANHLGKRFVTDWFNLGLVMFFVMSAFLYSKKDIKKENTKKWMIHRYTEIAIPSTITVLLALIYFALRARLENGTISLQNIICSILCGLGLGAFVHTPWKFVEYWFLTYILICYLSVPLIRRVDFKRPKETQFWAGIVVVSIILQTLLSALNIPISWGVILRFYLAYAIFKRYNTNSDECRKAVTAITILVTPAVVAICYIRYFLVFSGVMEKIAELLFIYTQTIAGLVLFYWLYIALQRTKKYPKIIGITDLYSYPIYLTHSIFIGYNTSIIDKFNNKALGTVVALILTAVLSVFVVFVTKPIKRKIKTLTNKE